SGLIMTITALKTWLTEAAIHNILERTREITQMTMEDWFSAYCRGEGVAEIKVGQPNVRVGPKVEDVVHVMAHPEQRMVVGGNMNRAGTYKDFCYRNPPNFEGIVDLVISTKWIKEVESVFCTSKCLNSNKVAFASSLLQDWERHWWDVIEETKGEEEITLMT
ncbi:hypothetical protein Tco_0249354, partial [Tanacetum coccineum]